jgi:hypothetical protein
MLYIAESAQFYSAFSPTTISLTPRFRRKHEVWLRFFAENAQNDPKTHSYEDNAQFNAAFSATTLSYASRFRRKRQVIENFKYLGEFEEYFRKWWLYCVLYLLVTERCKKKFKNRLWKSRACVPLSKVCWWRYLLWILSDLTNWSRRLLIPEWIFASRDCFPRLRLAIWVMDRVVFVRGCFWVFHFLILSST